MKSNSKEEVSRFTYQFDLERKITSRAPKWLCGRRREKGRENQSTKLSRKLSRICVEKQRALHAYLQEEGRGI
jgi:hypothetical protein